MVHYIFAHGPLTTACGINLPKKNTFLCIAPQQITCEKCKRFF